MADRGDTFSAPLYVGTDIGVYASNNGGATWARFQTGMPNVRVVGLELSPALNILAAGTHGRGMWEISVPFPSSLSASVAGLSSLLLGAPMLGSPMLSAAAAGGGVTPTQGSLAVAFALPLPGQAVVPQPATAPALTRQTSTPSTVWDTVSHRPAADLTGPIGARSAAILAGHITDSLFAALDSDDLWNWRP